MNKEKPAPTTLIRPKKNSGGAIGVGIPTQWKPGVSGNPAGRPRATKMSMALRQMVESDFEGKTGAEVAISALWEIALSPKSKNGTRLNAIREIFDRMEGKPLQQVQVVSEMSENTAARIADISMRLSGEGGSSGFAAFAVEEVTQPRVLADLTQATILEKVD